MGTLQGSWIWYDLMTPDPDGAKAFYEAVVGWSMTTGHGAGDSDYGFITAQDGAMTGGMLRLSAEMQQHGARSCWLGYIAVDDVDASVTSIEATGGKVLMAPRDVAMAGRVAMVSDPGGAAFYVMTPTPPPGGGESTAFSALPNPGHCGWNELMAMDGTRERGFYTNLFGWALPEPMDMGPMGKYHFIAHDGVTLGGVMDKMPDHPAAAWNHYFWVDSVTAAKATAEARGGSIAMGPHEVPGGQWVIMGTDPQGAAFALVGGQ